MTALLAMAAMLTNGHAWEKEVVYQIFPRSYYDSDGDRHGDLKGIASKLDEVRELGATALLINPVQRSRTYHNYFADDFYSVDPDYGSNDDFRELCRQAHRRKIKVLLDMEPQYVADGHPWWAPEYADRVWREGSWLYGIDVPWYDGQKIQVAAINPNNPEVREEMKKLFHLWQDLGADGFRLDHAMDDLDLKGVATGMLKDFWRPVVDACRAKDPDVLFVAEQADWAGPTGSYYDVAGVDAVFAFRSAGSFLGMDKKKIEDALRETPPPGRTHFVFIENHDMPRYASVAKGDPALMRLGAVYNLTAKGTPILYYGQELGMPGLQGKWGSDGNDIPIRLAYRWSSRLDAPGSATWYAGSGPWARTRFEKNGGGTSLEEQKKDPGSLYRFYQRLIALRKANRGLSAGGQKVLKIDNPHVVGYERGSAKVFLNLSKEPQAVRLKSRATWRDLWNGGDVPGEDGWKSIRLGPHGFAIVSG
ncbi:MAG TPA: alpha-amylase family glycosyl hydrolase [Fimbriimonas sp.]